VDGGDTKGAERILDRMAQAKPPVRPNEVTYNTLMKLYVDGGDTKGAERILDRMAQAKPPVRPNEVTYNTLMVLYASSLKFRAAMQSSSDKGVIFYAAIR